LYLVTRSNSCIEKRFRKKRFTYSRININQVIIQIKFYFIYFLLFKRDSTKHVHFETNRYETTFNQERTSLDATRRELDQYRIKVEGLTHDVIN